jgi:DNA-binding CsgD family transcriptional regulator
MHAAIELYPTRYFQGVLHIVDCLYAAACGEISWEETLRQLCRVGGLGGCALSLVDPLERRRVVVASYGLSFAGYPEATLRTTVSNPQLMDRILRSRPGAIWQERQSTSKAPNTATSFRPDPMPSNGLIVWACVVVARDDRQVAWLEVCAGPVGASRGVDLNDLLGDLAPHLSRAWRVGRTSRFLLAGPPCEGSPPEPDADRALARDPASLPGVVRLRAEFGLTKAEARLALRLAEGSSLASAAQAFGVKLTTIRSQLQQVFAKTGTSRQTELVAMLLGRGHGTRGPFSHPLARERQAVALAEPGSRSTGGAADRFDGSRTARGGVRRPD